MDKTRRINLGKSDSGEHVFIDIETLVSTRLLVTASSGGGKSETLRRILEEASDFIQCIVIDPEGEFSTLREKKPFVLIGEGGEAAADIRTAALVATRLLELNASAVCDIYEMRVHERHEWVKRFLDSMVHAPKALWHPVLVVIDEAHTYCPEHGYGQSVASQSIIDIANLGRKRGFCAILATQRLSKLNKNAVEPLQNYLVGRTTFDDQQRAASTFKIAPGAATRSFSLELERLKDGQFVSRGRAITGDMLKIQVIRGKTRPPETGTSMAAVVTPTPQAIKALLPKLVDIPHEVEKKAKTEEDLRAELRDAKKKIADLEKDKPSDSPQQTAIIASQKSRIEELESYSQSLAKSFDARGQKITQASKLATQLGEILESDIPKLTPIQIEPARTYAPKIMTPAKPQRVESKAIPEGNLTGPEQRILNAIAWLESLGVDSPEQPAVAFLAGYSYGGGGYNNPRGSLNTKGMVEYVAGSRIRLTDAGRELSVIPDIPSTNGSLHDAVLARLPSPEKRLLQPLLHSWPKAMTNQDLAEKANYAHGSGGFNNPRGRLKTLGLIEYTQPGMVRAKDLLFPETA